MIENDQLFVYKHRIGFVVIVGKSTILFVNKYPELENLVKYEYYLKYFKENFNLKFRRPHVDVCSKCERHGTKLKDVNINDSAKAVAAAELRVHKRGAKKFYNKIKEAQTLCTEVMGLVFDYMQNMLLPHTPVQEFFIIGSSGCTHSKYVHNIKENPGHFYTYHEGQSQKRPNEVCSFISLRLHNETYVYPLKSLNSTCFPMHNWWPDYYKKTCSTLNQTDGSKRETFAVSNYKQFLYESSSPGYVKTWEYIDGLHSHIIKLLKEHKENPPLPIIKLIKILYLSMRKKSHTSRR
nr:unnamed protein product [Callosobruchus analis]